MTPAPVRFLVEAALVVCVGVVLALAEVDLLVFAAIVAATLIVVAALERTVLGGREPRRSPREREEEALPLHEPGVEREEAAPPAVAVAAESAGAVHEPARESFRPTWRPPLEDEEETERAAEEEERAAPELPAAEELAEPEEQAPVEALEPSAAEPAAPAAALPRDEPVIPERPRVQLVEPLPEPEPEPALPQAPAATAVVELPTRGPREWNLWDLERRARERAGEDPMRDEEWAALFVYLREYATPDGMLPPEFDPLVRESFAGLLAAAPR
jgi:hypothetical protein